jgi:hypothetical protein
MCSAHLPHVPCASPLLLHTLHNQLSTVGCLEFVPVGLLGVQRMSRRDFGVSAAASCSADMMNPCSEVVLTITGLAPAAAAAAAAAGAADRRRSHSAADT